MYLKKSGITGTYSFNLNTKGAEMLSNFMAKKIGQKATNQLS